MDEHLNQQGQETTGENSNKDTVDREAKYKDLQSDYTRKSQRLKELETQSASYSQDNNAEEWKQRIKENVLAPEIENIKKEIHSDQSFNDLLAYNPELSKYSDAIRSLAKSEWLAYEDVIEKYKFWSVDKLNKAKERKLVWDRTLETQPKSISEMTDAEYEQRKKENLWGSKRSKKNG